MFFLKRILTGARGFELSDNKPDHMDNPSITKLVDGRHYL